MSDTTTPAPLPAPPPPPPGPPASPGTAAVVRRPPRPGQLTPPWRVATLVTWALVVVAWSGVWNASRQLGVATWWLGPDGDPQPFVILLAPFVPPLVMMALVVANVRRLPWYGLACAGALAVFGIVDLGYVRRLGVVELAIAGAAAAVSIGGFGHTYRRAPTGTAAATATGDDPAETIAERPR